MFSLATFGMLNFAIPTCTPGAKLAMPFIFQPDARILVAGRIAPPSLRRLALRLAWILVAATFLVTILVSDALLGFAFIMAGIAIAAILIILFLDHGLEEPVISETLQSAVLRVRRGETVNLASWCSGDAVRAFPAFTAVTVTRVLQGLLAHHRAEPILLRLGLGRHVALAALKKFSGPDPEEQFAQALLDAAAHAVRLEHQRVSFIDALTAFSRASVVFRQFLFDRALAVEDLDAVAYWEDRRVHERDRRRAFWSHENLFAIKPFGRTWAYGYTPTLDRFSVDLTERIEAAGASFSVLGRTNETNALERFLARVANANALLVGDPGVGVEDVISNFTKRVLIGTSLPNLNYRRIIAADFGAAIAGLSTAGEIEGRVRVMLVEAARAGGTILVIENFHILLGAQAGSVPIDLSAALFPILQGARVQVVATTTYKELHATIEKHEAIAQLFDRIEVREPDAASALQILFDVTPVFEKRFRIFVPFPTLKAVVTFSERTIQDVPFPKKAFDVLESALIIASGEKIKILSPEHIASAISERTEIPVGALTGSEKQKLLNLEAFIHERIVDQDQAVRVIADALRRARAGVSGGSSTRPIGTFLFMGPTGVGKTETAKALAEAYFGNEERMVRLDMSEFQGVDAADRLIGSPATREEGRLTTAIRENPFSLLLLDEFEKANPKVLDLFLQVFDEGRMKDGWGRSVSFSNALVIATSNAGAEFVREYVQAGKDPHALHEALREEVLRRGLFRPELLNRFDGVVVFKPLGMIEAREIAQRILGKLAKRVAEDQGIYIVVAVDSLERIIAEGFRPEFGARELRRAIQDSVETVVARKILEGAKRGDTIEVRLSDLEDSGAFA